MKLSCSILNLEEKTKEKINELYLSGIDLLHIDVMDNKFVSNYSLPFEEVKQITSENQNLDVHLMVEDVEEYINNFSKLNPKYITFHLEASNDIEKHIKLIKEKNIKCGISIKPSTKVEDIYKYLSDIDLVLVMSVEPGFGGQKFLEETFDRVEKLDKYRKENNLSYEIEVDGGINDTLIDKLDSVDIFVVGSFIIKGNFKEQVSKLKN